MMRVLIDTNVVLDHLMDRAPFATDAAALWQANREGRLLAYVAAITPINEFYIARKLKGADEARRIVTSLLATCRVCTLDQAALQAALSLPLFDYEDAAQLASASASHLDAIITRDPKDYAGASLPIFAPADFLKQLPPVDVA